MSLTLADVEKIANLARLELTAAEKAQYQQQLSAILNYAARLDELDLTAVAPTPVHAQHTILRDDEIQPSLPAATIFFNAPRRQDDHFLIQPVLEESEE